MSLPTYSDQCTVGCHIDLWECVGPLFHPASMGTGSRRMPAEGTPTIAGHLLTNQGMEYLVLSNRTYKVIGHTSITNNMRTEVDIACYRSVNQSQNNVFNTQTLNLFNTFSI